MDAFAQAEQIMALVCMLASGHGVAAAFLDTDGMAQKIAGYEGRDAEYKLMRLLELSKKGQMAAVKCLIEEHGLFADIEHRDKETGITPLLAACEGGEEAGETAVYLLSVGASHTAKNLAGEDAIDLAVAHDCLAASLTLVARGVSISDGLMERYGRRVAIPDDDEDAEEGAAEAFSASKALREATLCSAYANGPRPSQRWKRRKHWLCFLAENGFRPLARRIASDAAATAVADALAASVPVGSTETGEESVRLHLLGLVFSNEGLSREIAAFVPAV